MTEADIEVIMVRAKALQVGDAGEHDGLVENRFCRPVNFRMVRDGPGATQQQMETQAQRGFRRIPKRRTTWKSSGSIWPRETVDSISRNSPADPGRGTRAEVA